MTHVMIHQISSHHCMNCNWGDKFKQLWCFCRDIYTAWEGVGFALVPAPKILVLVSDSYPKGESAWYSCI